MADHPVGYKRPPVPNRFKPGISGNPKGRPKRKTAGLATIIVEALNAQIEYQEDGRVKTASGRDVSLMALVKRAVKGDVDAILAVLNVRNQAEREGSPEAERVEVFDWPPDFSGQTAEQKTQAYLNRKSAAPVEWWSAPETSSVEDEKK